MDGFVIAPQHNHKGNDATGAFHVGANRFTKIHGMPKPALFDNSGSPNQIYPRFLKCLDDAKPGWDVFAYFGHGDTTCLPSAHLYNRAGAGLLVDAIKKKANPGIVILLYACNTGDPKGFASWVADGLATLNATVYAHISPAGHSFMNPNVVAWPGGEFVVKPGSKHWSAWNHNLHRGETTDDLFALFPFMTQDQLEADLEAPEYLFGRWHLVDGKEADSDVVFFDDKSAAQTAEGRFLTTDRGTWTVTGRDLVVTWGSGTTERWPLSLDRNGQNVYRTDGFTKTHLKASFVSHLDHNPAYAFSGVPRPLVRRIDI